MRHAAFTLCLIATASLLAGCDALGIETASQTAEKKEAEGRAIGSACRHAVRSVEDCFRSNPRAGKAAVFAGWKDMDAYMRENEVVGMPFTPAPAEAEASPDADSGKSDETANPQAKPARSS